jgi:hypothetical protein
MKLSRSSTRGSGATMSLAAVACSILGPAAGTAWACPRCYTGALVRSAVLGPAFFSNLLLVSLPFIVLASIAVAVSRIGAKR